MPIASPCKPCQHQILALNQTLTMSQGRRSVRGGGAARRREHLSILLRYPWQSVLADVSGSAYVLLYHGITNVFDRADAADLRAELLLRVHDSRAKEHYTRSRNEPNHLVLRVLFVVARPGARDLRVFSSSWLCLRRVQALRLRSRHTGSVGPGRP